MSLSSLTERRSQCCRARTFMELGVWVCSACRLRCETIVVPTRGLT